MDIEYSLRTIAGEHSGRRLVAGKEIVMDTMTYASVAMLPKSIAENRILVVRKDLELPPLDLSMIRP